MIAKTQPISSPRLDGHSSELTAISGPILMATRGTTYIGSYPDDYPSESLLKDGGSPTMTARSSAHGYPNESTAYIGSYPDGYPSESLLKDRGSPTMTARRPMDSQQPIAGSTMTATPTT